VTGRSVPLKRYTPVNGGGRHTRQARITCGLLTGCSLRSVSAIGSRRAGATVGRLPLPILHRSLCYTRSLGTVFLRELASCRQDRLARAAGADSGTRCGAFAQHVREGGTGR
jgi:hypothetical protein